ncbi:predicted protein, partial [Nematostella vectensis]
GKKEVKATVQGKGPKTWIREGAEEEPVDFMDANVVQRVVATDPRKGKRKLVNDFETSSDGKLIIPADEEDEDDPKPNRKKSDAFADADLMDLEPEVSNSRKKGTRDDEDDDDEEIGPKKKLHQPGAEYRAKIFYIILYSVIESIKSIVFHIERFLFNFHSKISFTRSMELKNKINMQNEMFYFRSFEISEHVRNNEGRVARSLFAHEAITCTTRKEHVRNNEGRVDTQGRQVLVDHSSFTKMRKYY